MVVGGRLEQADYRVRERHQRFEINNCWKHRIVGMVSFGEKGGVAYLVLCMYIYAKGFMAGSKATKQSRT
jgi:hypothetical protein